MKGEQHAAEQRAEKKSAQRLSIDDVRDAVISRAALDYLELAKVRHAPGADAQRAAERRPQFWTPRGSAPILPVASFPVNWSVRAVDHRPNRTAHRTDGRPREDFPGRARCAT